MRICITLDDVIRAKTAQIGKIYKKYVNGDIDLDALEFNTTDFAEIFGFDSLREYQDFLYNLYSYEIFAEASTTEKLVDKKFNLWHMKVTEDGDYDEPVEIFIANPFEFNNSIGYTCFFLSKIATRIREFYFPMDSSTIWDKCDVLVTAEPKLLENKPEGKVAIKVEMPYNKEYPCDYTYSKFSEFLDDNNIINKLINKE